MPTVQHAQPPPEDAPPPSRRDHETPAAGHHGPDTRLRDAWLDDAVFLARFWAQVDRRGADECWPWRGRTKPHGYGHVKLSGGTSTTASRVALSVTLARLLSREQSACHTCDNPPCCNPAHLFVGTQSDNALDSVRKGRANRSHGSAHREAKLTEEQIAAIREPSYYFGINSDLGREYGVSRHTIRQIRLGNTWRHVR